jgi:hypothetical protein
MFVFNYRVALAAIVSLAGTSGCVSIAANSPIITSRLQMVSAGHTGCLPGDNAISNVTANPDGSGIWNATCQGRIYLCTAVGSTNQSESFSCAPVAKQPGG